MLKEPLFSESISNPLHFGGNISPPNLKERVYWTLAHLLTPQGPLGPDPYRIYQGFSICFKYFWVVAPPKTFFN